ncbi:OmpH family outer membrane protein [Thioclava sp. 'Guangxiensis']|uniref:OmpH family outer membrane protein n=1 Tax=Thioclava sp. 'Guangxiensis' TaxID=3149044 RepID=UPI003877D258
MMSLRHRVGLIGLAGLTALVSVPALAQTAAQNGASATRDGAVSANMPILTLDWDELYQSSEWARRVKQQLARETASLGSENKRIADDLVSEEKSLTQRRASMTPQAFQKAAAEFDKKATDIRAAQKAKAEALAHQVEAEQQAFLKAALPLLDDLLREKGAQIVIDRRVIIRGLSQIDVTDDMRDIVDAKLGSGIPQPVPEELGGTAPDPASGADSEAAAPKDGADLLEQGEMPPLSTAP